jgi:segregation and condensation protein A
MTAPAIELDRFDGPLDLLLSLVRKNQVDITEIPIAEITRQYLDYLKNAEALDLDLGSEFAYMAATLIQIKSRLLLPPDPEIAAREPDPRQELIRQLLHHDQVREAAEFLHQQLEITGATWTKGCIGEFEASLIPDEQRAPDPGSINLMELLRLARKAVETARTHDMLELDTPQITVEEMISWLKDQIEKRSPNEYFSADPLFCEEANPARRIALFLGILEMARDGSINVDQRDVFAPIFLRRVQA